MSYFSAEHLRAALKYMANELHPSLMSMLAMLRVGVEVTDDQSRTVKFGSTDEKQLLIEYMSPAGGPGDFPFYMPFGRDPGPSRWRNAQYPGKALQRQRSDRKDLYRQTPPDSGKWLFASDLVAVVSKDPKRYVGNTPVKVTHLAAWFYRVRPLDAVDEAIDRFVGEFRLEQTGLLGPLFDKTVDAAFAEIGLASEPVSSVDILTMLAVNTRSPVKPTASAGTDGEATETTINTGPEKPEGDWSIDVERLYEALGLVGMREAALRCVAALRSGRHVILTGPPGTGKTTLAEGLCRLASFPAVTVSATDQWTTFDTIGGYFPSPMKDGPQDRIDFLPGAVLEAIEQAKCVIIDEINRADIDKAFGEFLTLLAAKEGSVVTLPYRRRGGNGELRQVQLQVGAAVHAGLDTDIVVIPSWWRLVGTMNDSDKASLKKLSTAFIRRFVFVPVTLPDADSYETIVRDAAGRRSGPAAFTKFTDTLVDLFTRADRGFAGMGLPLGPSFPLDMLRQAESEWLVEPGRSGEAVLMSCLEGVVSGQFQGRVDLHDALVQLLGPLVGVGRADFARRMAVWTGAES